MTSDEPLSKYPVNGSEVGQIERLLPILKNWKFQTCISQTTTMLSFITHKWTQDLERYPPVFQFRYTRPKQRYTKSLHTTKSVGGDYLLEEIAGL